MIAEKSSCRAAVGEQRVERGGVGAERGRRVDAAPRPVARRRSFTIIAAVNPGW